MSQTSQAARFTEFRQSLYNIFNNYADVLMNTIDALSSNTTARSVVELSLNPAFERGYSALFKGIAKLNVSHKSRICQPQKSESKPIPLAKQMLHEGQTDADSITSNQGSQLAQPPIVQKPALPTPDPRAAQDAAGFTQSACNSKPTQVRRQHTLTSKDAPLQASSEPQQSTATQQYCKAPDSNIEPQQASLTPPQATVASPLNPVRSNTCESAQASLPKASTTTTKQLTPDKQAQILLENEIQSLVVPYLPTLQERPFHLFAIDVTSQPRQFSPTLQDRGFVYQPNAIRGNKPVTIGHQYSVLAYLPEKSGSFCPPWVVPLSTRRVATSCDKELVGQQQLQGLIKDQKFDFNHYLSVQVVDCSYSKREYLYESAQNDNLVTVARARSDRTFYRKFQVSEDEALKAGHPTWYGERFSLKETDSWHEPDRKAETSFVSRRGKKYKVKMQAWHNMLMKGKDGIDMHKVPFTLLRVCRFKPNGEPAFKNDLWLIIVGNRRDEITLLDLYEAYLQRFDIEHYFRFGKQKLLMTAFQSPEVERDENWWKIVQLAYTQLWLAAPLAQHLPRPWEKHLPRPEGQIPSPSTVQRDFGRITRQLGTPANPPKVCHKGTGRRKGQTIPARERHPVLKKGTKSQLKKAA